MIKKEKGITLVSLVITIVLMLIIAGTTVHVSLDRFEINKFNKMKNDIELLQDKVSNYYLKYNTLPVLREDDGSGKLYTYTTLDFEKNNGDNENYYILDLEAMEGISLNYGEEGFENPNASEDVYIINEDSHVIYYVKGIELKENMYHYFNRNSNVEDSIAPTKPQIKVISGKKNASGIYTTDVQVEIIPGKDNISGVSSTTYSVNGGEENDIATLSNNIYEIPENGNYTINVKTYAESGKTSEISETIEMHKLASGDFVQYNVEYIDMFNSSTYTTVNGWRVVNYTENANGTLNIDIISAGIPAMLNCRLNVTTNAEWFVTDDTQLADFRNVLTENGKEEYIFYSDEAYASIKVAAGLYYNLKNIKFAYGTESRGYNLGYFTEITSNGATYNAESNEAVEKTGNELFIEEERASYSTIRTLTLPELNNAVGIGDVDLTGRHFEDSLGLYTSSGEYYLASPLPSTTNDKQVCCGNSSRRSMGKVSLLWNYLWCPSSSFYDGSKIRIIIRGNILDNKLKKACKTNKNMVK